MSCEEALPVTLCFCHTEICNNVVFVNSFPLILSHLIDILSFWSIISQWCQITSCADTFSHSPFFFFQPYQVTPHIQQQQSRIQHLRHRSPHPLSPHHDLGPRTPHPTPLYLQHDPGPHTPHPTPTQKNLLLPTAADRKQAAQTHHPSPSGPPSWGLADPDPQSKPVSTLLRNPSPPPHPPCRNVPPLWLMWQPQVIWLTWAHLRSLYAHLALTGSPWEGIRWMRMLRRERITLPQGNRCGCLLFGLPDSPSHLWKQGTKMQKEQVYDFFFFTGLVSIIDLCVCFAEVIG